MLDAVRRKVFHYHLRMVGQPRLDHFRATVDAAAIPNDSPFPWHLPGQVFQELNYFFAVYVLIDPPPEVQPDVPCLRTKRYATDGRDSVVGQRATHDHSLPPRSQGPANQGGHQKPRFVQESNVRTTPIGLAQDAGELIRLPAFHFLVVALPRPDLRLVAGRPQPRFANLPSLPDKGLTITLAIHIVN